MKTIRFLCILCAASGFTSVTGTRAEVPEAELSSPRLICLKYSSFELFEGEKITGGSGDMESMRLTINGPAGEFDVKEGEVWAPLQGEKHLVSSKEQTRVYSVPGERPQYAIYGSHPLFRDRLLIWLSGPALKGTAEDSKIYGRFTIAAPNPAECFQSFSYSWPDVWSLQTSEE